MGSFGCGRIERWDIMSRKISGKGEEKGRGRAGDGWEGVYRCDDRLQTLARHDTAVQANHGVVSVVWAATGKKSGRMQGSRCPLSSTDDEETPW